MTAEADARRQSWQLVLEKLQVALRDEYEVLSLIGYGGMAGVFLAVEHRLRRRVALKVMSPELMLGHKMVERFQQEAVTQANLEHPNIAAVHAVSERQGLHYFAMQYVGGRTLQAALRDEIAHGRLLSYDVVRTLLHQVGSALDYAHSVGVIHRDVKPGNVLLAGDGRALVTDFGIAKVTEGPALTAMSVVQGTASYMSPEQCYAAELTGASDQYALGIMAFELLTGRVPFAGDTFSIMQAHASREPDRLDVLRPDCPAAIADAVQRMVAKSATARFPTIGAALEAMDARGLSPRADDPIRREIGRLAATDEVMRGLGDDVRRAMLTPRSIESVMQSQARGGIPATEPAPPITTIPVTTEPHVPDRGTPPSAPIREVVIEACPLVLALGERLTMTARCLDASGEHVNTPIEWRTDAADVLAVDSRGTVTGLQWGAALISVVAGGRRAEVRIAVGTVPIARIGTSGVPPTLAVGATTGLGVQVVDAAGRERAIPVQVTSTDPSVLQVFPDHRLQALRSGSADLVVRCGNVEVRERVVVAAQA